MKKLLSVFVAVAMVMGFAMTASAADSVNVTLTSPTITKAEGACEKVGAVTFEFGAGAVLEQGDWWYMDLPEGAELCKDIDYLIVGQWAVPATSYVVVDSLDPTLVTFGAGATGIGSGVSPLNAASTTGPITVQDLSGGGTVNVVGNVALRVVGESGSRRVQLYVASDVAGVGSLTVTADTAMKIKILDGQPHNTNGVDVDANHIIVDLDGSRFAAIGDIPADNDPVDNGRYLGFGEHPTGARGVDDHEIIDPNGTAVVPHLQNTLCVNAEDAAGNLFVSFASKNDFLTFTGDSQIAHTGASATITLETCTGKTASADEIEIGEQGQCTFDYESAGTAFGNGYCPTHLASQLYLSAPGTFGEIDELYDMEIQILNDGVYFGGSVALRGFLSSQDVCDDGFAAGAVRTPAWTLCAGSDCTGISVPTSCEIDDDEMVDRVYSSGGAIKNIQNFTQLAMDFSDFYYVSGITAGTEVEIEITLNKYPCGEIWSDTFVIGTFVTECTSTATGTSSLFFPFLPGSQFVGWWGGYVIANGSASAGTAELTATDVNGNAATYTTPEIPAYGQFNASFLEVSDWTQATGNAANFDGTENYTVFVTCDFSRGAGMAMLGNSTEGVGYTAETTGW